MLGLYPRLTSSSVNNNRNNRQKVPVVFSPWPASPFVSSLIGLLHLPFDGPWLSALKERTVGLTLVPSAALHVSKDTPDKLSVSC